jgi:uncharacterized oxidoreductase
MRMVDVETLERITQDIFVAWRAPRADASWIASLLVRANLRGHDSHGVIRIPHYVHALKTGEVNPTPSIKTELETPTIARIDGDKGFGQVVARHGITIATAKARAQGLIGMLWVNAPTALNVAPWGGAARRLGTNPHAVAVPGPNATVAMSHDFATSVVAEGKLKVKFNRGEKVAPGIMRNGRGEPSTDPREYYTDPPGSLITAGEHKGYGLSLAVEILGGILSGTGAARPDKGPVSNGVLMMCVDPGRFLPPGDFHSQVATLFGFVRSAPLAGGAEEILIPGEPEERTSRERRAGGVPVDDETWRQIKECAAEVGVDA